MQLVLARVALHGKLIQSNACRRQNMTKARRDNAIASSSGAFTAYGRSEEEVTNNLLPPGGRKQRKLPAATAPSAAPSAAAEALKRIGLPSGDAPVAMLDRPAQGRGHLALDDGGTRSLAPAVTGAALRRRQRGANTRQWGVTKKKVVVRSDLEQGQQYMSGPLAGARFRKVLSHEHEYVLASRAQVRLPSMLHWRCSFSLPHLYADVVTYMLLLEGALVRSMNQRHLSSVCGLSCSQTLCTDAGEVWCRHTS